MVLGVLLVAVATTARAQAPAMASSDGAVAVDLVAGAVPGPGVTGDACAYSIVVTFAPNAVVTPAGTVPCSFPTRKGLARLFAGPGIVPGVGILATPKFPVPAGVKVTSTTTGGSTPCVASGVGQWSSIGTPAGPTSTLSASASVLPLNCNPGGEAAGYAKDPFTVAPGTYTLAPVIDHVRLVTGLAPSSSAIFQVIVESSLASSGPLWSLSLALVPSGTDVTFYSAPVLGLNDAAVEAALLGALDLSTPGVMQLNGPYTLFTTTISSTSAFTYGEEASAYAATSAPEPAMPAMLATGLLFVGAWVQRRGVANAGA